MIVYCVTNIVNGKRYIGQTVRPLETRWYHHQHFSHYSKHPTLFSKAIAKHGGNHFITFVLDTASSKEELNRLEKRWIASLQTNDVRFGYNLTAGGDGGTMNDSVKQKLREANIGKRHSEASITKMSAALTGRAFSSEHKHNLSIARQKELSTKGGSKITREIADEIRKRAAEKMHYGIIAARWGVSKSTVCTIARGKTWKVDGMNSSAPVALPTDESFPSPQKDSPNKFTTTFLNTSESQDVKR